jgi:aryl-alcohol dehydrogenase-like predicted oxidoreductase
MEEKNFYAKISGLDQKVSRIFFGTAFQKMQDGGDADEILDAAISDGVNAFDTARGYGMAENSLGNWIRERGNRDKIIILSKCGNVSPEGRVHVDRQVIENELEESLKALGTDYIDIYLLHRDDLNTPISEFVETLNEEKKKGKIRIFGVSNWTVERIEAANQYAKEHGLEGFSVSSPHFGLAEQVCDPWGGDCVTISGPDNKKAQEWYRENQMPVEAYSSLGHGFFSGKFKAYDEEGARRVLDEPAQKGYLCATNMERLKRAEELAKRDGCTVPEIAMRYIFSCGLNMFAAVTTTKPERLAKNIRAAKEPLSAEDVKYLEFDA